MYREHYGELARATRFIINQKNKLYKNKKPFLLNCVEITTYYKTED